MDPNSNPVDKKFYIIFGVLGVVLIVVVVLTFVLGSPSKEETQVSTTGQSETDAQAPDVKRFPSSTAESLFPADMALKFYNWYVNHPNPLGSGEFKKLDYVTENYKKNMEIYVKRGDHLKRETVLNCQKGPPTKNVIASKTIYDGSSKAYVVIQKNSQDIIKSMYKIVLVENGSKWMVEDVWCMPTF